jgi:hypothetical protein
MIASFWQNFLLQVVAYNSILKEFRRTTATPSPLVVVQPKAIYTAMGPRVLWDSEGEAVNPAIGI